MDPNLAKINQACQDDNQQLFINELIKGGYLSIVLSNKNCIYSIQKTHKNEKFFEQLLFSSIKNNCLSIVSFFTHINNFKMDPFFMYYALDGNKVPVLRIFTQVKSFLPELTPDMVCLICQKKHPEILPLFFPFFKEKVNFYLKQWNSSPLDIERQAYQHLESYLSVYEKKILEQHVNFFNCKAQLKEHKI